MKTPSAQKSNGVTLAEQYLARLGKRSFLSLWSYPNVYYAPGKELTDLLVICGDEVLIFQDKWSVFPLVDDINLGWKRWFDRTVADGARQVWGAERRLRNPSSRLFLDGACKTPFPIPVPNPSAASFHLIVVTHGGSKKCREVLGGSGSFMIQTGPQSSEDHTAPFTIGDLDLARTFVHVMDDTTLDILMGTLDTITDLTLYLKKKVALLRGSVGVIAAGEEELLSNYLKNVNDQFEHDFDFNLPAAGNFSGIAIDEGYWTAFQNNPQRLAQVEQNRVSYMWDALIEEFNHHAIEGTQYSVQGAGNIKGVGGMERIVRFMAKESRFKRRLLASNLKEMIEITSEKMKRVRVIPPAALKSGMCYAFLVFPPPSHFNCNYEEYRIMRFRFLEGTCMVAKLRFPDAEDIVGIATESGLKSKSRSEDAMYLDARIWTLEMETTAREYQEQLSILVNPTETRMKAQEYPEVASRDEFLKNPRNKPCPCGSGKKYKKCCSLKGRTFYN